MFPGFDWLVESNYNPRGGKRFVITLFRHEIRHDMYVILKGKFIKVKKVVFGRLNQKKQGIDQPSWARAKARKGSGLSPRG